MTLMRVCLECNMKFRAGESHKCKKKRTTSPKATRQNTTIVTPALSVAEQLAVLAKLRKDGSLTEQEFATLKSRLISGGDS